jgi:hypothetical protein
LGFSPSHRRALRRRLSALLATDAQDQREVQTWLLPAVDCAIHLPADAGTYTDFYAGIHHALNVGRLFRPDNPLSSTRRMAGALLAIVGSLKRLDRIVETQTDHLLALASRFE